MFDGMFDGEHGICGYYESAEHNFTSQSFSFFPSGIHFLLSCIYTEAISAFQPHPCIISGPKQLLIRFLPDCCSLLSAYQFRVILLFYPLKNCSSSHTHALAKIITSRRALKAILDGRENRKRIFVVRIDFLVFSPTHSPYALHPTHSHST